MSKPRPGGWYRLIAMVVKPLIAVVTRRDWRGMENLPDGGCVIAANHNTYFDTVTLGHYLWDARHPGYYLAKASLFSIPVVGRVLRGAGQIPVYRGSREASAAFRDALAAVRVGKAVMVYPEGTITRDPDLWPMKGKSGAARIALATGAPVIPIAQWGAHEVLAPYGKRLRLFPRKTMHITAGPPVDLSDLAEGELTVETLRAATERIMDAITALLAEIRGEQPPAKRYDMSEHRTPEPSSPADQPADDDQAEPSPRQSPGAAEPTNKEPA